MKLLQLSAIAAAAALLVACGGSDEPAGPKRGELLDPARVVADLTPDQIDAATAASGLQALTGKATCGVKILALNYATIGAKGEPGANSSGALMVPTGPAGSTCATAATPLLAYAHGTVVSKPITMADPNNAETMLLAAFYAAQGYSVVASDYLGYAQSTYAYHPYLHADSEASSVIDSIRAARNAAGTVGVKFSGKVMVSGYSQGGHSSMATQRTAEAANAGEINLVAGAHLAGPYNLAGAMKVPDAIAGYQFFVPFIITSWQKVYGNVYDKPEDAFKAPYVTGIENLLPSPTYTYTTLVTSGKLPGGTPNQARDALMQPAFLQMMQTNDKAGISVDAQKNTLFNWIPKAPTLLCGGAGEPTVPPAVHQLPMFANFQANGVKNVGSVDVDAQIQAVFGPGGKAPTDPASPEFAAYYGAYHGTYEPPFCMAAARQFFDQVR
ncbi:MAG: esterase [Proteobacteria bacterium]|nr:esterase [Pseudomonadota bacterium]